MRVFFASSSYPSHPGDWKGVFIRQVVAALARRTDISVSAWVPPGVIPPPATRATSERDEAWLGSLLDRGGVAHLLRVQPLQGIAAGLQLTSRLRNAFANTNAELFHVNWLQNALALPADGRPALITVLGSDMDLLRLPGMTALLRLKFRGRNVVLCPNATWMVEKLDRCFGDLAQITPVPFGIDPEWFGVDRQPDMENSNWLCVSRLTTGKLGALLSWGEAHFAGSQRRLHLFGPRQEEGIGIPDWVHYHGPIAPAKLRQDWFPHAAGLISLSEHPEGLPQVMLEAMAARLPILASRLPAHEALIEHEQTGWLCDDEVGLAQGLRFLEDPLVNAALGSRAKTLARTQFGTWDDCAGRYAAQYQALAGNRQ